MAQPEDGKNASTATSTAASTGPNVAPQSSLGDIYTSSAGASERSVTPVNPGDTSASRMAADWLQKTGSTDLRNYPDYGKLSNAEVTNATAQNFSRMRAARGGDALLAANYNNPAPTPAPAPAPSGDNRPSMGPGMYNGGLSKSENWNPSSLSNQYRPDSGDQGPMKKNVGPEVDNAIKNLGTKNSSGKDGWGSALSGLGSILDAFGVGGSARAGINRKSLAGQKYEQQLEIEKQKAGYRNEAEAAISKMWPQAEANIHEAIDKMWPQAEVNIRELHGKMPDLMKQIYAKAYIDVKNSLTSTANVGAPGAAYQAGLAGGQNPGGGPEGRK